MKIPVLMLSTAPLWLGTARMPRALARAGFDVYLLAPQNSLASKSRYVTKTWLLPDAAIPMEWLMALVGAVDACSPRLLIPGDEMTIRLLFALLLEPMPGFDPVIHARLATLVRDSLGDPDFYQTSIDKTLLPAAAEALGVRMPPFVVVNDVREALTFAARLGYPVVLKRRFGFAGHGVAIVSDPEELRHQAHGLLRPDQLDLGSNAGPRLLVQAFVKGRHLAQALVVVHGATLGNFAWERYQSTEDVAGQTSVVRFVDSPETKASAEALSRAFGMSGFLNLQYVVEAESQQAYLLEINRRIVTHMHMGERVGADLALALNRYMNGAAERHDAAPANALGSLVTVFPREVRRDPHSRYLRECPVDAPWDDPALFAALIGK